MAGDADFDATDAADAVDATGAADAADAADVTDVTDATDPALRDATAVLDAAGFDVIHAFGTATLAGEPGLESLVDLARPGGLLIGNSRALWPRFVAARRDDPALAAEADPLDRYTERVVERAAGTITGACWWVGHRRYQGGYLPLQRLAVAVGLGALAETQLVIHPTFGPWFALRAVITFTGVASAGAASWGGRARPSPCTCDEACRGALARAQIADGPDAWRAWLAVREACPVGREHRYSDEQIAYHYTRGLLMPG